MMNKELRDFHFNVVETVKELCANAGLAYKGLSTEAHEAIYRSFNKYNQEAEKTAKQVFNKYINSKREVVNG